MKPKPLALPDSSSRCPSRLFNLDSNGIPCSRVTPTRSSRTTSGKWGEEQSNNVREAGRPDLSAYAFLAGGLHDVAKYTDFFQSHLMGKRVECSDHAKLSSLIGLHASELLRKDPGALSGVPEGEVRAELYSVFVALAIYSHHGSLKGMKSYLDVLEKVERDLNNFSSCIVRQYNDLRSKWNRVKEEVKWAP